MALCFGGDWKDGIEDDDICLGISPAMRESLEDDYCEKGEKYSMKNKAIITTSANPFHYGHLDIYKKAKKIFDGVTVIVAYNRDKTSIFDKKKIAAHLEPYNIPFEILSDDCKTVADYCMQNNVTHIVRGIRNGTDAEYELKIDFVNREIFPNLQTVFLPTSDTFSNISSSVIRELLACGKEDIVMQYMSPAALKIYKEYNKNELI